MKSHFLAIHPLIGTKNKAAPLHHQQRSVFYWWWAYLKRNAEYLQCCEVEGKGALSALYADFGDVRGDEFRSWWGGSFQRGAYLFAERQSDLTVKTIDGPNDLDGMWNDETLVVAVNLTIGRRKLQSMFAKLLQRDETGHKGKRGRKAMGKVTSTARYPLHRNFSVHNLKRMLMVYDAVTLNESLPKSDRKPLWAIGEDLKLVPSAMPSRDDNKYDTRMKHNTMTMTVSRYANAARSIIANTAKGQFPNSDD
jgi:hypothetical protein